MRQRRTNRQMAMPQLYPGTVEGVAEAIEVETVAARPLKRLQLGNCLTKHSLRRRFLAVLSTYVAPFCR
jgi:hypothetical protein